MVLIRVLLLLPSHHPIHQSVGGLVGDVLQYSVQHGQVMHNLQLYGQAMKIDGLRYLPIQSNI